MIKELSSYPLLSINNLLTTSDKISIFSLCSSDSFSLFIFEIIEDFDFNLFNSGNVDCVLLFITLFSLSCIIFSISDKSVE